MGRRFPLHADASLFIERLYALAEREALDNVEITTPTIKDAPKRTARKNGAEADAKFLQSRLIKVAFDGKYREIAQFFKELQDIDQYSRIVSFDMKPGKDAVRITMTIEIVSFEVSDAA